MYIILQLPHQNSCKENSIGQNLARKKEYNQVYVKSISNLKSQSLHITSADTSIINFYAPKTINPFIFHLLTSSLSIIQILGANYSL